MRKVLALVVCLWSTAAIAVDYTFKDGYYWNGDKAYQRYEQKSRYYHNGCYSYRSQYYYQPVAVKYVEKEPEYKAPAKVEYPETPTLPSVTDENWRQKLLELAGARDKWRAELKASALEHNEFMEAVRVLGLEGQGDDYNPRYAASPYQFGGTYQSTLGGGYGSSSYSKKYLYNPQAAQGSTVYGYAGYDYATLADVYGTTDMKVLYDQASRLATNAQSLAGEANVGFQQLIGKESNSRERVAYILAQAQLLRSAAIPEVREETQTQNYGQNPQVLTQQHAAGADLGGVIHNRCVQCHSASVSEGKSELFPQGVNMEDYQHFTFGQKQRVMQSIISGRMPKGGKQLEINEMALFLGDLQAASVLNGRQPAVAQ